MTIIAYVTTLNFHYCDLSLSRPTGNYFLLIYCSLDWP